MQSEREYKYMFVNIVYIPKPLISNISLPTSAISLHPSALIPQPSSISLQTSPPPSRFPQMLKHDRYLTSRKHLLSRPVTGILKVTH